MSKRLCFVTIASLSVIASACGGVSGDQETDPSVSIDDESLGIQAGDGGVFGEGGGSSDATFPPPSDGGSNPPKDSGPPPPTDGGFPFDSGTPPPFDGGTSV